MEEREEEVIDIEKVVKYINENKGYNIIEINDSNLSKMTPKQILGCGIFGWITLEDDWFDFDEKTNSATGYSESEIYEMYEALC